MYFRQSDWRNNHHGMYNSEEMMVKKYFHTNPEGDMDNLMNCLLQNPMPLRKNLADTIIVTKEKQKKKTMLNVDTSPPKLNSNTTNGSSPTAPVMAGYMPYFRVPNIVSNLFNAVKGAVSAHWRTKSPQHDESSHQMSPPTWQSANGEVQNKSAPDSHSNSKSDMNIDCRLAAEQCEKKLCQLTSLLPSKPLESGKFHRRRPKRQFVEPDSVEEQFEDALSPEDVATLKLANDAHFGCQTVYQVHEGELFETASPNIKIETKHLEDMDIIKTVPVVEDKDLNSVNSDINLEKVTNTDIVLENCVDLVQEDKGERSVPSNENKCSKLTNLIEIPFDNQDTGLKSSFKHRQPSKHIVHSPTKDKHYKNPNRTTDKRKKCKQRMSIQDDLVFANEIASEDMSSVENSPSIRHFDKLYKKHAASSPISIRDAPMDSFNEISGRFNSTSSTNSDEAFQIVFNDSPKESRLRQLSDCDSEDSFIVFDDSPDGCYTTNDVFSESDESFSDSSDSETELSDTHEVPIRTLSHYTKTCSDLTNDSLYVDKPMDVVDCAVRNVSEDKPRDLCGVQKAVEGESSGVLLNDSRKLIRRSQPQKKVHFSSKPPQVHVMRVWAFAARQARAGHWERCVIDRERFKRRIADVDLAVSWVLKPQHRSRVMFQRFMPWWNAQKRKELAEKRAKEEEDKAKLEMAENSVDGNVNSARENNGNTVGINGNASLDNENAKNANNRLAPADVAKLNKVNGINVDCNKDAVNGNDGKRNLNDNNLTDLDTLDALNVNDSSKSALNCNLSTAPVNGNIDNLPRAT